jgi:hypothetical protein
MFNFPYQIYSVIGQLVVSGTITSEEMELHLGSLSEEIHLLQIGTKTKKIVKTNVK